MCLIQQGRAKGAKIGDYTGFKTHNREWQYKLA